MTGYFATEMGARFASDDTHLSQHPWARDQYAAFRKEAPDGYRLNHIYEGAGVLSGFAIYRVVEEDLDNVINIFCKATVIYLGPKNKAPAAWFLLSDSMVNEVGAILNRLCQEQPGKRVVLHHSTISSISEECPVADSVSSRLASLARRHSAELLPERKRKRKKRPAATDV